MQSVVKGQISEFPCASLQASAPKICLSIQLNPELLKGRLICLKTLRLPSVAIRPLLETVSYNQ